MTFGESIGSCLSKYATFRGRAPRSEFWLFYIFNLICLLAAGIGDFAWRGDPFGFIYGAVFIASFLPLLSVTVRRLHDTDHSGWWYWIILIPIAGAIILLIWLCTRGTNGDNRFGPETVGSQSDAERVQPPNVGMKAASIDVAEQLEKLARLHSGGALTDEEFNEMKSRLIGN